MNKGEATRQRIIAEAAPIFNQRGYEGCSMQDVLDVTGLEKGGLYRHFSNKEELAVEAFKYALGEAFTARIGDLEPIEGSIAKLRHMVKRFVESPSPLPGGCPLMNTAIDSDDGNPALRKLATEGVRKWKSRISRIVETGVLRGEILPGTEPRRIANTLVATLEGALMISRLEGTRNALRDAMSSLEQLLDSLEVSASRRGQVD